MIYILLDSIESKGWSLFIWEILSAFRISKLVGALNLEKFVFLWFFTVWTAPRFILPGKALILALLFDVNFNRLYVVLFFFARIFQKF